MNSFLLVYTKYSILQPASRLMWIVWYLIAPVWDAWDSKDFKMISYFIDQQLADVYVIWLIRWADKWQKHELSLATSAANKYKNDKKHVISMQF